MANEIIVDVCGGDDHLMKLTKIFIFCDLLYILADKDGLVHFYKVLFVCQSSSSLLNRPKSESYNLFVMK